MGRNSIKANLSEDDIVSDIKLSIAADIQNKNIFMVVEGEADRKFIQRYLSDNVCLYESYAGKTGVENIVVNWFSSDIRVIGIRDRDYQTEPVSNKIFFYDYGCLEMMMMRNDIIFRNLCAEYYEGKENFQDLRINILDALKYISVFRMISEIEGWGLNFAVISISNVWDAKEKKIKEEDINEKLKQANKNLFNEAMIEKAVHEKEIEWREEDFYYYTNGHDAFKLFALVCNENRSTGISHSNLEASCRCAFGDNDFKATNLYFHLKEYSKNYHLKILCI